ncbi:hypothetical protein COV17_00890 [Candidatus Woesearchaeota archaeon CG10_big_fil_rev_8_21_14_0_10_36_11]|nr:MAG: hypothetical protein COV17_00890 [Candidatus Woesearchaeota archaeon CG10_big_fil_rev_8_21_14_0_10_36_11]
MCRMLIAVGKVQVGPLLDAITQIALDQNSTHELNRERERGTFQHADGWGIAYIQEKKWVIHKSTLPIFNDPKTQELRNVETSCVLLHVRRGTKGENTLENTHPFLFQSVDIGNLVFCHNGTIQDNISHSVFFNPKGTTDSERLFYSILTKTQKCSIPYAITKTFDTFPEPFGSNIIFSTIKKSFVYIRSAKYPTYMQMHLGKKRGLKIISSEHFPHIKSIQWKPLQDRDLVIINNKTGRCKIKNKKAL